MDIKIYNHNFDLTESFQEYLEEKFRSLEKYQGDIISFHVNLKRDPKHQKGEVYSVEVKATMPQKTILIVKEVHEDARAAVDMAQDKLARQLVKQKEKAGSKLRNKAKYLKSLKFWKRNQE